MAINNLSEKDVVSIMQDYFPYFAPFSLDGVTEKLTSEIRQRAGVSLSAAELKNLLENKDSQFSKDIFSMIATFFLIQEVEKSRLMELQVSAERENFTKVIHFRGPSEEMDLLDEEVKQLENGSGEHKKLLEQFKLQLELYNLCYKEIAQWEEKRRLLEMQLTQQSNRHRDNFNAILEKKGLSPKFHFTQARQEKLYDEYEKLMNDYLRKKEHQQKEKTQAIQEIQATKEFQIQVGQKVATALLHVPATADERKLAMKERMNLAKTAMPDLLEEFKTKAQISVCDANLQAIHAKAAQVEAALTQIAPMIGLNMNQLRMQYQNTSEKSRELENSNLHHGMRKH